MSDTTNSAGEIVSGTRVKIKGDKTDTVYDIGEVYAGKAMLYFHNKKTSTFPLSELVPV